MKKFLLLCLTALMCCVTGAWAITGSGTESDPYVVQSGDKYTITSSSGQVYISFTAPENGTLNLAQTGYSMLGWMVKSPGDSDYGQFSGMKENYGEVKSTDFPDMKAGNTYLIKNNGSVWGDETITVTFTSATADPNYFSVESDPAEGSVLGQYGPNETVMTFTTSRAITYMRVIIDGSVNGRVTDVQAVPVGEGTPVLDDEGNPVIFVDRSNPKNTYELKAYKEWKVATSDVDNNWTFYNTEDYTFSFVSYTDQNAWYDNTPEFTTSLVFKGSVEPKQYSDIYLESITPSIDTTDPNLMPSSKNPVVSFTFSGLLKIDEVASALGQGMGLIPLSYEASEENGKTKIDVTLEGGSNQSFITVYVSGVDAETGLGLNDTTGPYAGSFSEVNSSYTVNVPWADGRTIDYLLTCSDETPKDNSYMQSLEKVSFRVDGAADVDKLYAVSYKATAGVYNEAGEKLYDIFLSRNEAESNEIIATVCELGSVNQETLANTPVAITEPGVYIVQIDSMAIGDGNFDPSMPWQTDMGGMHKGRCNPTWRWTYNVVDEIVTVKSVDPVPYDMSGEFNTEIPAEIKLTMSSPNFTVVEHGVTARYGMNIREPLDYTVDGDVLTVKLSENARKEPQVTVMIAANSNSGAPIIYGADSSVESIILTYMTDRAKFVPETVTPADGSNVTELSKIVLDFGQGNDVGNINMETKSVSLESADGKSFSCTADYDSENYSLVVINVNTPITEKGTYTLTIPEEMIYNSTYNMGFSNDNFEPLGDFYNPELTYVYYISDATGISAIKTDANGNVKVYTIDGLYVGEGAAAKMIDSLPAGVYIVNGTKIAVNK